MCWRKSRRSMVMQSGDLRARSDCADHAVSADFAGRRQGGTRCARHVISHKDDLDPPGERMLSAYIKEKFGHEFVFRDRLSDRGAGVLPYATRIVPISL